MDGKILRNYGKNFEQNVSFYQMIFGTRDGESLIGTSNYDGLREISVRGFGVVRDFGKPFGDIRAMSD